MARIVVSLRRVASGRPGVDHGLAFTGVCRIALQNCRSLVKWLHPLQYQGRQPIPPYSHLLRTCRLRNLHSTHLNQVTHS